MHFEYILYLTPCFYEGQNKMSEELTIDNNGDSWQCLFGWI